MDIRRLFFGCVVTNGLHLACDHEHPEEYKAGDPTISERAKAGQESTTDVVEVDSAAESEQPHGLSEGYSSIYYTGYLLVLFSC